MKCKCKKEMRLVCSYREDRNDYSVPYEICWCENCGRMAKIDVSSSGIPFVNWYETKQQKIESEVQLELKIKKFVEKKDKLLLKRLEKKYMKV